MQAALDAGSHCFKILSLLVGCGSTQQVRVTMTKLRGRGCKERAREQKRRKDYIQGSQGETPKRWDDLVDPRGGQRRE